MNLKLNLLLCGLILFVFQVRAQNRGDVELGIGGGVNVAGITGDYFTSDSRTAFNVDAFGDFYFSDRWSLKAKIQYDQKGYKTGSLTINDEVIIKQETYKLNYVTVPVMANWHFGKKRNWYMNFGPYIGMLVNAKASNVDVKDRFNTVDVGLDYGIGVKIPIFSHCKLFLGYDVQYGFTDIVKNNPGSSANNLRVTFHTGVAFSIK